MTLQYKIDHIDCETLYDNLDDAIHDAMIIGMGTPWHAVPIQAIENERLENVGIVYEGAWFSKILTVFEILLSDIEIEWFVDEMLCIHTWGVDVQGKLSATATMWWKGNYKNGEVRYKEHAYLSAKNMIIWKQKQIERAKHIKQGMYT